MKILFSIGRYWPAVGGAETVTRELAARLAEANEVSVATLVNDNDADFLGCLQRATIPERYRDGRVEVHRLCAAGYRHKLLEAYVMLACRRIAPAAQQACFGAAYTRQLTGLMRDAEVVHCLPAMSMSLVRLAVALAARRKKVSVITPHLHSAEEALGMGDVLRQVDGAVAFTEVEKDWLIEAGLAEEQVEVTGIGHHVAPQSETGEFRKRYGLQGPIVLFLGRKEEYKGYRQILEAVPQVWERLPKTNFVFIGPATPASRRDFRSWRAVPRILELTAVDEEEKSQALTDCDMLCVPSMNESFGHVFLEAWGRGKPVIAADIPIERAVIEHEADGLLVPQEPPAIAAAIIRLLKDPEAARAMGEKGRQKLIQHYSWEEVCTRTQAFYERLWTERRSAECPSTAS